MAKNKVEISGINTSKLKTLSREELKNLFIQYKQGDKSAKDIIVENNLGLH